MIYAEAFVVGLLGYLVAAALLRDLNVLAPIVLFGVGAVWSYVRMPSDLATGAGAVAAAVFGLSVAIVGHSILRWHAPATGPKDPTRRIDLWGAVTAALAIAGGAAFALGAGLGALLR